MGWAGALTLGELKGAIVFETSLSSDSSLVGLACCGPSNLTAASTASRGPIGFEGTEARTPQCVEGAGLLRFLGCPKTFLQP